MSIFQIKHTNDRGKLQVQMSDVAWIVGVSCLTFLVVSALAFVVLLSVFEPGLLVAVLQNLPQVPRSP